MAEIWPDSWLVPEMLEKVLDFIEHLPVDAKTKKNTLFEWCKAAGVKLTGDMVMRVTGRPAGEV